jgi:Family of unknown function (DUF5675)
VEIVQKRYLFGKDFTLSRLYMGGMLFPGCQYILEDKVREITGKPVTEWKIKAETAIPAGRYKVVIDMSTRFKKQMLHLLDVPGYEGIRIHSGNTSHDTEGCLITGRERDEKNGEVSGSRVALASLYPRIEAAIASGESVYWTVGNM